MIKVVNSNEFKSEIEKDMVLVDFFAEWCGPCKMISPILDELQVEFKDKINIIKVNVDNNMDIAQQYNISNIPALVVLKKGEEVQRLMGFSPKHQDLMHGSVIIRPRYRTEFKFPVIAPSPCRCVFAGYNLAMGKGRTV